MAQRSDLIGLQTEERNPNSTDIDTVSSIELCQIINNEDATVASAVKSCIPTIAAAIDAITPRVRHGGRVVYVGAGTSGRLGVLDASEIPPTFSASPAQFVALIAGGDVALRSAQEGAEDAQEQALEDLDALNLDGNCDSLIGIAASGRTPYVLSCLAFAKSKGCVTIGIACSTPSSMRKCGHVDFMIEAVTGPEVVTGSTRMKAGTATKLLLNMISTGVMIKTGKTFGNIMIDLKPTNVKLQLRARRILREICKERCPESDADLDDILAACDKAVKVAAAKIWLGVSVEDAKQRLQKADGILANLISDIRSNDDVRYVLCVDGGGSNCRAVIRSSDGGEGIGIAGPSNPTDMGVEEAMSEIDLAIQRAVNAYGSEKLSNVQELRLSQVWVALAGIDRQPFKEQIRLETTKLLGSQPSMTLRVTNDLELLATVAGQRSEVDDVIVLVAGTGSVAFHYRREGGEMSKVGRAGGWGALLGDDGSGFDIGRQAIRLALRELEEQPRPELLRQPPDALIARVTEHFRSSKSTGQDFDLLTSVLLSDSQNVQSAASSKKTIASCARVVIDATSSSDEAKRIVLSALFSLMNLVLSLKSVDRHASEYMLVLVGGLMSSEMMQKGFRNTLSNAGYHFKQIEYIDQPALVGAEFLARRAWKADR